MPKFDLNQFVNTAERIRMSAIAEGRLLDNPSDEELRPLAAAEPNVRETGYGSLVTESEPMSRAAAFTKNSVDHPFGRVERELLAQCESVLSRSRIISVDRIVGDATARRPSG